MKQGILIMVMGLFLTSLVVGCNMMKGAGKDMENAGGSIQKTVDKND